MVRLLGGRDLMLRDGRKQRALRSAWIQYFKMLSIIEGRAKIIDMR